MASTSYLLRALRVHPWRRGHHRFTPNAAGHPTTVVAWIAFSQDQLLQQAASKLYYEPPSPDDSYFA